MKTLSRVTKSIRPQDVQKDWHIIDAEGLVVGRVASIIANILRGKHKASYTPHVDCGDHVVVINADKVQLTDDKRNEKVFWHTGYPGGIKHRTNGEILEGKYPERVVIQAVKRMLPGNRLARQQMTHLKVFAGPAHGMEAQKPETLDVRAMYSKNTRTA